MALDLSHKPTVLYLASVERIVSSRRLIDQKPPEYVLACYTAGLAVECILQAVAIHHGAAHDARHTLVKWLEKCPTALNDALKGTGEWNLLVAVWDNSLRYLSFDGLVGFLREKGYARGKKGGVESIVRANVKALVNAAEVVHAKGLGQWLSSTRR